MTTRVKLTEAMELELPDGSVIRLRWDTSTAGLKVFGETAPGAYVGQTLAVLPQSCNSIVLKVT